MSFEMKKIYTENPYVDELVYYTKLLGAGTVLKLKDLADRNETVESLKAGGLYIACIEKTAMIEEFSLTKKDLQSVGIIAEGDINNYKQNPKLIPLEKRSVLLNNLMKEYIENYIELNPYYRSLNGLPPKQGDADFVKNWICPEGVVIDLEKPIHEMNASEVAILEQYGIIEDLIQEDPINRQYMKHLGKKKIDIYLARRANRFDPLFIPKIDSEPISYAYKDKLDENKFFVLRTVYSEAFKYDSEYYDNFIAIFIVLITMIDIISRVQEFITRKEIFDIRSIEYIFKSYGVPFFENIPMKYQIAMVKNLHTLLKYKSTAKCMVDICSLFGFKNIKIFKYYLLKDRRVNLSDGDYIYEKDENGEEDLEEEFELKFLKLPLEDDLDEYIRSGTNYIDYDEITESDPRWDGGLEHNAVMKEILKEEFNFTRTKYISIDTIYEIAKMSAQQCYFFNFLYDNVELESLLKIQVPAILAGAYFKVSDIFTLLTCLTYLYNNKKDIIITNQDDILFINGFNFKADLATLAAEIGPKKMMSGSDIAENTGPSYIVDPGSTLHAQDQLKRFKDITPVSSIPSFKEMMNIYTTGLDIREELIKGMREADRKEVYDVYKKLYDSLMIVQLTFDFYQHDKIDQETGEVILDPESGKPVREFYKDEEGDITYTEFLKHSDYNLYSVLLTVNSFDDQNSRNQYIANIIDSIIYALEEYIDTDEFQSLFSNLPMMGSESVKQYIALVINFYKSYKVDFLGFNTIYIFDDKYENLIRLIDRMEFDRYFERPEFATLKDAIYQSIINKKPKEQISLIERLYFDIYTWISKYFQDNKDDLLFYDSIHDVITKITHYTIITISETFFGIDTSKNLFNMIFMIDSMSHTSTYDMIDNLGIKDIFWIVPEGFKSSPYMSKLSPSDNGRFIVSDDNGDSSPGPHLSDGSFANGNNLITEKDFNNYLDKNILLKSNIVTKGNISNYFPSEEKVISEKALIDLLSINTLKGDQANI